MTSKNELINYLVVPKISLSLSLASALNLGISMEAFTLSRLAFGSVMSSSKSELALVSSLRALSRSKRVSRSALNVSISRSHCSEHM